MRGFKRLSGELFSLSFGTIPGRRVPGFACVVSGKVVARAAARNAIKRRCRAVFQKIIDTQHSLACVYYAKKAAHGALFSEIEREVTVLYKRACTLA